MPPDGGKPRGGPGGGGRGGGMRGGRGGDRGGGGRGRGGPPGMGRGGFGGGRGGAGRGGPMRGGPGYVKAILLHLALPKQYIYHGCQASRKVLKSPYFFCSYKIPRKACVFDNLFYKKRGRERCINRLSKCKFS